MLGIYLVSRHADLIVSGQKTAIVKKRQNKSFLSNDLYLMTKKNGKGLVYGKIKLEKPRNISFDEFNKLRQFHCITDAERRTWWPGSRQLVCYNIKSFEKLERPKETSIGAQSLSNMEATGDFVKDIESYNPMKLKRSVLLDDWKIVSSWWSAIHSGKNIKYSEKQIISLAKTINDELLRRGIAVKKTKASSGLCQKLSNFSKLMPVYRGKIDPDREEILLDDFTKKIGDIVIHKDFAYVTGSLVNWRKTKGDIDILLKADPGTTLWNIYTFRIMRAFPEFKDRFHFSAFTDFWKGPISSHVPLGDLVFIANPKLIPIDMSAGDVELPAVENGNLVPYEKEWPIESGKSLIDSVNIVFPSWQSDKVFVSIRKSGIDCQFHVKAGSVMGITKDGRRIEQNLPTICKQLLEMNFNNFIAVGTIDLYSGDIPTPGIDKVIDKLDEVSEKQVKLTIADVPFFNEAINNIPFRDRRRIVESMPESENIKLLKPIYEVYKEECVRKAVASVSRKPGSLGAEIRLGSFAYSLDGSGGKIVVTIEQAKNIYSPETDESMKEVRFIYSRRFWKNADESESDDFHIMLEGVGSFHLRNDLFKSSSHAVYESMCRPEYFVKGKHPANCAINAKSVPAFVDPIDLGKAAILSRRKGCVNVMLKGTYLEGIFSFVSNDGIIWNLSRQESGTFSKKAVVSNINSKANFVMDFSKKVVLGKDLKFPYPIKTVAFSEGVWHERPYSWEVVREAAPLLVGSPFVTYHLGPNDPITYDVGICTDYEIDDEHKRIIAIGELFDTTQGKDCATLIANQRITDVSVRLTEDYDEVTNVCRKILSFPHIAFVRDGEVEDAKICFDGKCQR